MYVKLCPMLSYNKFVIYYIIININRKIYKYTLLENVLFLIYILLFLCHVVYKCLYDERLMKNKHKSEYKL